MKEKEGLPALSAAFLVAFLSLYALLLFLAESSYILVISLFFTLFYCGLLGFFLLRRKLNDSITDFRSTLIISGFILILYCILPFSLSVPQTVFRLILFSTAGLTFCFFTLKKFSEQTIHSIFSSISVTHAILLIWNISLFFFPSIQEKLPVSTLLTSIYGHNHAYILYLISLNWSLYTWREADHPPIKMLPILFFLFGIVVSFSRVGVLIALLLLGYELYPFFRQRFTQRKLIVQQVILAGATGIIAIFFSAFFILSTLPQFSLGKNCIFPIYKTQLCKSLATDGRVDYWVQALKSFKEHPLIGSGGGTFVIASFHFRSAPQYYSSMAHNEYIQLIMEYGLLGLVAVCGYFFFLCKVLLYRSEHPHFYFLQTSLLIFTIDAFFNFNFSFTGVILLFSFILAISQLSMTKNHRHSPLLKQAAVLSFFLVGAAPLWFCGSYLYAQLFLSQSAKNYVQVFPYQEWFVLKAMDEEKSSLKNFNYLTEMFRYDSKVIKKVIEVTQPDDDQKIIYFLKLVDLDRFDSDSQILLLRLAMKKNRPELVFNALKALSLCFSTDPWEVKLYYPTYLEEIVSYANSLSSTDPVLAGKITKYAYSFEYWRINNGATVFLQHPDDYPDETVIELLPTDKKNILWKYGEPLSTWMYHRLPQDIAKHDWKTLEIEIDQILAVSPWYKDSILKVVSDHFDKEINNAENHRELLDELQSKKMFFLKKINESNDGSHG